MSVLQTLKQSAMNPAHALIFNYASEALNNSFFLSNLVRARSRALGYAPRLTSTSSSTFPHENSPTSPRSPLPTRTSLNKSPQPPRSAPSRL